MSRYRTDTSTGWTFTENAWRRIESAEKEGRSISGPSRLPRTPHEKLAAYRSAMHPDMTLKQAQEKWNATRATMWLKAQGIKPTRENQEKALLSKEFRATLKAYYQGNSEAFIAIYEDYDVDDEHIS